MIGESTGNGNAARGVRTTRSVVTQGALECGAKSLCQTQSEVGQKRNRGLCVLVNLMLYRLKVWEKRRWLFRGLQVEMKLSIVSTRCR